ncbi:MAG: hypothetical protein AAB465_00880 [Patescibacteria group bacterium]
MNIIPKDSRYIPFTQQMWCCAPTCIQMVMYRRGIPLVPAELIGHYLGLTVPRKDLRYFWHTRTGKKSSAGWGTKINQKKYAPNNAFKKLHIPLKLEFKLIDQFEGLAYFKNYLQEIEKKDKDVLACYEVKVLDGGKIHGGHVCVIDRVYLKQGKIRLIDPSHLSPKWKIVSIKKLYEAMKFHGVKNSGGFWELTPIKISR